MKNSNNSAAKPVTPALSSLLILFAFILVAAGSRLVPHWPNFTAIGALALVSGRLAGSNLGARLFVPMVALLISDFVLGFHSTMHWVYGGFALVVLVGEFFKVGSMASAQSRVQNIFGSLVGSTVFFVVSNVGVWWGGGLYPQSLSGLGETFVMALPFFHYQILGDFLFVSFFALVLTFLSSERMRATFVSKD